MAKMKGAFNFAYSIVITVVILVGGLMAFTVLAHPGAWRLLVVQSGSMAPTIKVGSVIIVGPGGFREKLQSPIPEPRFLKGDIATFLSGKEYITHRIAGYEYVGNEYIYETKGDANNASDVGRVKENQVVGRVLVSVPYLGFVVEFAKSQLGFITFIIIPATLIVYSELLIVKNEIAKVIVSRKKGLAV